MLTLCNVFSILFQDEKTKKNSHIKRMKVGFTLRFCYSKVYGNFTLSFHVRTIQQLIKNMGKCLWKWKPEVWVSIPKRMENNYYMNLDISPWGSVLLSVKGWCYILPYKLDRDKEMTKQKLSSNYLTVFTSNNGHYNVLPVWNTASKI